MLDSSPIYHKYELSKLRLQTSRRCGVGLTKMGRSNDYKGSEQNKRASDVYDELQCVPVMAALIVRGAVDGLRPMRRR